MSESNESNRKMLSLRDQFTCQVQEDFFEVDSHVDVQEQEIDRFHILHGPTHQEDIVLVIYKGIPYISIYNANGRLVDVDHYLPDDYHKHDLDAAESTIYNLKNLNISQARLPQKFASFTESLDLTSAVGFAHSLRQAYGLNLPSDGVASFFKFNGYSFSPDMWDSCKQDNFYLFLKDLIHFQKNVHNQYIHITANGNIIITPINKRSGVAVMIETKSVDGILLTPNKWMITRTNDINDFDHALAFRSDDVRDFFSADGYELHYKTTRHMMHHSDGKLTIDSVLDNTDNVIEVPLHNDCYHFLPSDKDVIVALSHDHEVTIVNTHGSIIPRKWPKKVVIDDTIHWCRSDDNLNILFVQNELDEIVAYDISGTQPEKIQSLGVFEKGFEVDQSGSLIVRNKMLQKLVRIQTNATSLKLAGERQNLSVILKNLSHLFKGEGLFTKTHFAKVTNPVDEEEAAKEVIPSYIESAKFDFETNVEHMIVNAGDDYEALLGIQNKIAIARQNLVDTLSSEAEKEGGQLLGQRLQKTVNSIVNTAEIRIKRLIEELRAETILKNTKAHQQNVDQLVDPDSYRVILNEIRGYEDELKSMQLDHTSEVLAAFKEIQISLNTNFSEQISQDDTALHEFIIGEITTVEAAISNTHDIKQLQSILNVHPAALELMSLLKQPFILQNIAKEKSLSPAGIQSRLFKAVKERTNALLAEIERKEAERQAAKLQFMDMIRESIEFFSSHHTGGFSDIELKANATYQQILVDIFKIEERYKDVRLATELRRKLERRILERNREKLESMVTHQGKYAYVQNDPDLYIDLDSSVRIYPSWELDLVEKQSAEAGYYVSFIRSTDKDIYRPSVTDNLDSNQSFDVLPEEYTEFIKQYRHYVEDVNTYEFIEAVWKISVNEINVTDVPQFNENRIQSLLPTDTSSKKALRCALEKRRKDYYEKIRTRNVPIISPEFIDQTPHFQLKLHEFLIKAKLQLLSGSGIILLSGPPSTGKSAFLKFAAALMNREYFEHTADKWQTKNSLTTAIKFGEYGPYATPAGFTKAITTPYSMLNIEEIKEWPEALRKSLNPFFAGSQVFITPDGTKYTIGQNILICAAANLGTMYRQDDEPFTADFWSRIEVVEYNYGPEAVDDAYIEQLLKPELNKLLTIQDVAKSMFNLSLAGEEPTERAKFISQEILRFLILPKADEHIKRKNLDTIIINYFKSNIASPKVNKYFSPEEAAKVSLRRIKDLQHLTPVEFFDMYNHFVNNQEPIFSKLTRLQTDDVDRYKQYKILILCLRNIEGCLREIREQFYTSAGALEIEGTNREFIKSVYLLGLLGKL